MAFDNSTPFSAERTWVRDRNGAEVWLVAVRGSFLIKADGKQVLDDNQQAVSRVPTFSGEPGLSSLVDECDLVHTKLGQMCLCTDLPLVQLANP